MESLRSIICWILLCTAAASVFVGCVKQSTAPSGEDVRSKIAEACGIEHFGLVQKLQYSFNQKDGEQTIRRFWIWEPGVDRVTFKGDGAQPAVTYNRKDLTETSSALIRNIDQWFLHDSYWLILPFRIAWDHQAEVADMGLCQSPIKAESARCVNVVYPATVEGYILGDTYKLFLDGDYRILESIYQAADAPPHNRAMRWVKYRQVGPTVLSLSRTDSEGQTTVWFSSVGVQVEGGKWLWAD